MNRKLKLPLIAAGVVAVALGAAEAEPATMVYHQEGIFGGVTASSFRFG